ncbi:MAG TPA: hypothetical protein VMQ44_02550 [Candidatus Saccharimonadales bacterium]|nr:hypothetical protein [Candidatus Saccharimonadales bacterium]
MPPINFDNLFLQADNLRNNGQVDEAIKAYLAIAGMARDAKNIPVVARAVHMAGVSCKESVADANSSYYRDAKKYFEAAIILFKQLNDAAGLGAIYRDAAITADYASDAPVALENFQKSIEILNKVKDEVPAQLGITLVKLGLHYFKHDDLTAAEKFVYRGIQYLRQDPTAGFFNATALYDRARILYKQDKVTEAFEQAEESLSWFQADHGEEEFGRRKAQLHGLLAVLSQNLGHNEQAKTHLQEYQRYLSALDSLAAKVVEKDLNNLTGQ